MIDAAALVAKHLIDAAFENVAADELPAATGYPAILVRCFRWDDPVPPTRSHEMCVVQVDVIGNLKAFADGVSLVGLVADSLHTFGVHNMSVVQKTDDSVSPARPRWVLTGDLLARSN